MERLYADWIDDCETQGSKFVDKDFRIEDARNRVTKQNKILLSQFGVRSSDYFYRFIWKILVIFDPARNFGAKDAKYRRLPKKAKFIVDGIDALDVNQV